jgi:hypothetical protein
MKTTKTNQFNRMLVLSAIVLFSIPNVANASNCVKGLVLDNNNQPIESATATLINPETDQIVAGDMCNENGEYIIENVEPGNYVLSVRNVGFEKNESTKVVIDSDNNIVEESPVLLNESIQELNELEVTSKSITSKQPIEEIMDDSNSNNDMVVYHF